MHLARLGAAALVPLLLVAGAGSAQDNATFVANAYVDGRIISGANGRVQLTFEGWSSDETRTLLLATLIEKGGKALAEALRDTEPVGHLRVGTRTSYPIAYARSYTEGDLRVIFAVTDRPIGAFEAVNRARTLDYSVSIVELRVDDNGAGRGVLIVGAEIVVDMEHNTLSVEDHSSATVRLVNVRRD